MMDINFGGVYRSAVSCCRQMEKYNCVGSIVLVGSMSAFIANKGLRTSVYNCSKAAVVQLGRSLAMEWSSKGIRVNGVAPGPIWTPLIPATMPVERAESHGESTPLGRAGQPAECAPAYVFFSPSNSLMVS